MDEANEVRITLRLPADLRDRLTISAERNARSMNGEILARLDASLDWDDGLTRGNSDQPIVFSERVMERLRTFIDDRLADEEFLTSLVVGGGVTPKKPKSDRSLSDQAGSAALSHIIELRGIYGEVREKRQPGKILLRALEGYLGAVSHLVEIMEYQVGGESVKALRRELEMTKNLLNSVTRIYR